MEVYKYIRGGVWWCELPDKSTRGVLAGMHPVIIISSVSNPFRNCSLTVIPISSMKKSRDDESRMGMFFTVPINITEETSFVCCNQITTVSTYNLKTYIGQISDTKLRTIENELVRYLQLTISNTQSIESNVQQNYNSEKQLDQTEVIELDTIETKEDKVEESTVTVSKTRRPRKKVEIVETQQIFSSLRQCYMYLNITKNEAEKCLKYNLPVQSVRGKFNLRIVE